MSKLSGQSVKPAKLSISRAVQFRMGEMSADKQRPHRDVIDPDSSAGPATKDVTASSYLPDRGGGDASTLQPASLQCVR